jgi:hypothetical protein
LHPDLHQGDFPPFRPSGSTIHQLQIPTSSAGLRSLAGHNRFISFGVSAAVNSRLQMNGLTIC